jgi:hypothetical protein
MKKIILIFMALLILGCQLEPEVTVAPEVTDYYASITVNESVGFPHTDFIFNVDANDEVVSWTDNGKEMIKTRSLENNFSVGTHTIEATTTSGETVSLEIEVLEKEYVTRFEIVPILYTGNETTKVEINYPILTREGIDYNIEDLAPGNTGRPVQCDFTETERIVYINMFLETGTDSFIFHSNNIYVYLDFYYDEIYLTQLQELLEFLYYVEPEPDPIPEPTYSDVSFNLSHIITNAHSNIVLLEERYILDGVSINYKDAVGSIVNDIKIINIRINVGAKDDFLFRLMDHFFSFDFVEMTKEEVIKSIEILNRYPEEDLYDLVREYDPLNPCLEGR